MNRDFYNKILYVLLGLIIGLFIGLNLVLHFIEIVEIKDSNGKSIENAEITIKFLEESNLYKN